MLIQGAHRWLVEAVKAPFRRRPDPIDLALAELRMLTTRESALIRNGGLSPEAVTPP